MDIILVAGLWLDASAWDDVVPALTELGHHPVAVSLPGQGAPPVDATLADQRSAVVAAVDAADGPALVVGHSAAGSLAWMAADSRPDRVARVVMIGGFPSADGDTYADFFPVVDGVVPFPGWNAFEEADVKDLDPTQKEAIAASAIPVSGGAITTVHLDDERRYDVPVTVVCPEFSAAQAHEWIDGGEVPELSRAKKLECVDIDSGHWPMFSKPKELAALIAELAHE